MCFELSKKIFINDVKIISDDIYQFNLIKGGLSWIKSK